MCEHNKANMCGCSECGCNGTVEDRIRAIEISRELQQLRIRCMDRKIKELKAEKATAGGK